MALSTLYDFYEASARTRYASNNIVEIITKGVYHFLSIDTKPEEYIESYWCQQNCPYYSLYHMRNIRHVFWYMHYLKY